MSSKVQFRCKKRVNLYFSLYLHLCNSYNSDEKQNNLYYIFYISSSSVKKRRLPCCVVLPLRPNASPKVACLPRADSGAGGGREPALPRPEDADAGRDDEEGPASPMSSSSSIAATPLGSGKEASRGVAGRILAAEAVVAWADCIKQDLWVVWLNPDAQAVTASKGEEADRLARAKSGCCLILI